MGDSSSISNPTTFPSLFRIGETMLSEISDGELVFHLGITLYRVFISFFIAMIIGICLGMLMGNYKRFDLFLMGGTYYS